MFWKVSSRDAGLIIMKKENHRRAPSAPSSSPACFAVGATIAVAMRSSVAEQSRAEQSRAEACCSSSGEDRVQGFMHDDGQ